jgi:hypothetical protein
MTLSAKSGHRALRPRPLSQGEERYTGKQLLQRPRAGEAGAQRAENYIVAVSEQVAAVHDRGRGSVLIE